MKHCLIAVLMFSLPVAALGGEGVQPRFSLKDLQSEISFGVKAGLNYSNVWDEEGRDFVADHKVGLAGGLFMGIPIWPFLGFQPELLISQKGFEGSGTMFDTTYSLTRTTTHLDIPLQLQFRPFPFITFVGGPQFSFLLHERNEYRFGSSSDVQEREFENQNIRRNTLGFVVGGDVNILFLVFSARIGWDFQANHGDGSSSTPRYKNQWGQLTAGVRF